MKTTAIKEMSAEQRNVETVIKSLQDARAALPGEGLDASKMPGHWLLARLGKRVLRPGGLELTHQLLGALDIRPTDSVVEFAPGLGVTARLALARHPADYTAVERDERAANNLRRLLTGPQQRCLLGSAEETGLPAGTATVVYGEAMLQKEEGILYPMIDQVVGEDERAEILAAMEKTR